MTKGLGTSWLRIGVGVVLIISSVVLFVTGGSSTEQLVLQGVIALLAIGMLVQGITGLVAARRR